MLIQFDNRITNYANKQQYYPILLRNTTLLNHGFQFKANKKYFSTFVSNGQFFLSSLILIAHCCAITLQLTIDYTNQNKQKTTFLTELTPNMSKTDFLFRLQTHQFQQKPNQQNFNSNRYLLSFPSHPSTKPTINSSKQTPQSQSQPQSIKHPFLKKNSRQNQIPSKSKNHQRQQNVFHPSKNKSHHFNKINEDQNIMEICTLPLKYKKDITEFIMNNNINNQQSVQENGDDDSADQNIYKTIQENGILHPPGSYHSNYSNSQKNSRIKTNSFQPQNCLKHNTPQPNQYPLNLNQKKQNFNTMNIAFPIQPPSLPTNPQNQYKPTCISFLPRQQLQLCPELYALYRSQHLLSQINYQLIKIRIYSQGRKQIKYSNGIIQIFCNKVNEIKLIRWPNGDFKIKDQNKVSYWNQELKQLDQYFID